MYFFFLFFLCLALQKQNKKHAHPQQLYPFAYVLRVYVLQCVRAIVRMFVLVYVYVNTLWTVLERNGFERLLGKCSHLIKRGIRNYPYKDPATFLDIIQNRL